MWVKAVKSFGGKVSMGQGQEMELEENDTLQDLLEAGYVAKIMVNGQEPPKPDKEQPYGGFNGLPSLIICFCRLVCFL